MCIGSESLGFSIISASFIPLLLIIVNYYLIKYKKIINKKWLLISISSFLGLLWIVFLYLSSILTQTKCI